MLTVRHTLIALFLPLCTLAASHDANPDLKRFIQTLIANANDTGDDRAGEAFAYVDNLKDRKPVKVDPFGVAAFIGASRTLCDGESFDARVTLTCEYQLSRGSDKSQLAKQLRQALASTIIRHTTQLRSRSFVVTPEHTIDFEMLTDIVQSVEGNDHRLKDHHVKLWCSISVIVDSFPDGVTDASNAHDRQGQGIFVGVDMSTGEEGDTCSAK